jgi:hypothetical protein
MNQFLKITGKHIKDFVLSKTAMNIEGRRQRIMEMLFI